METQIGGVKAHIICYRKYESDRLHRIINRCRNFIIQMKEIVSNFDDDHTSYSPAKFNWRITATFINTTLPISTLRITFIYSTLDFGNQNHFADICTNKLAGNSHWDTLIFQHTRCPLAPSRQINDQWLAHTRLVMKAGTLQRNKTTEGFQSRDKILATVTTPPYWCTNKS